MVFMTNDKGKNKGRIYLVIIMENGSTGKKLDSFPAEDGHIESVLIGVDLNYIGDQVLEMD